MMNQCTTFSDALQTIYQRKSLPQEYVIKKFYELGYKVQYLKGNNTYRCCCPICREGKSFGKKRRCFYIPKQDLVYCFNCGWSSKPLKWIMEAGGLTYNDIMQEINAGEYQFINLDKKKPYYPTAPIINEEGDGLPEDAINLLNPLQLKYYRSNATVLKALRYLDHRHLLQAINRPKAFFLSPTDTTHRNRIIIPFYDNEGNIPFYQSRAFGGRIDGFREDVRYLSKKNATRSIFGIDRVRQDIPYLFLFEGPIDACFVMNGLGVGGISLSKGKDLTSLQLEQLEPFRLTHRFVWILDSQYLDETAKKKSDLLLNEGEYVFQWSKDLGSQYKDFNEVCMDKNVNELDVNYIIKHVEHK